MWQNNRVKEQVLTSKLTFDVFSIFSQKHDTDWAWYKFISLTLVIFKPFPLLAGTDWEYKILEIDFIFDSEAEEIEINIVEILYQLRMLIF